MSRYKFDRSREFIPGYKVGFGHWRDRGISHYKSVMGAGAKAKSVTNNLPLLSVLYVGLVLNCPDVQSFIVQSSVLSKGRVGLAGSFTAFGLALVLREL